MLFDKTALARAAAGGLTDRAADRCGQPARRAAARLSPVAEAERTALELARGLRLDRVRRAPTPQRLAASTEHFQHRANRGGADARTLEVLTGGGHRCR